MSLLSPVRIKSRLVEKLEHLSFRRRFFRTRAQDEIAQQIRELRERRKLRQIDLAKNAKMKQSAVSRIEQAGYSAWSFKTLLRVADALDAQLRVVFEASEDVIARYKVDEQEAMSGVQLSGPSIFAVNPYRNDRRAFVISQREMLSERQGNPTELMASRGEHGIAAMPSAQIGVAFGHDHQRNQMLPCEGIFGSSESPLSGVGN
jgi:transcriptional regulator with XRE-family HTH domain